MKLESLKSKPKSLNPKHKSPESSLNIRSFLATRIESNRLTANLRLAGTVLVKRPWLRHGISKLFLENRRELQEGSKLACSRRSFFKRIHPRYLNAWNRLANQRKIPTRIFFTVKRGPAAEARALFTTISISM